MIKIIKTTNPYTPSDGMEIKEFTSDVLLSEVGKEFFDKEWLCVAYLGGKRYFPLRKEWEEITLKDGDCVHFMPHVGEPITIILAVVAVVVSVITALNVQVPTSGVGQPEADPVFDKRGQRNQNRIGQPIEDGYGRVRLFPSVGGNAYNQYFSNNQFQYQLLCFGHGSWEIENEDAKRIGDTPFSGFQDITSEIYQPGEPVTLFPDNVETSPEVGGIVLFGSNEDEYEGITGPFVANAANTVTTHIEVDVVLPMGLYFSNDNGGLSNRTASFLFEYREIDNQGTPIGNWETLADISRTLRTNTPQRFTFEAEVPEGRYEVRGQRTNNADTSARAGDTVQWSGLRAFLPSIRDYGDVTMIAIRARATNNLNDNSSGLINVIATRKLPIYDPATKTLAAIDDYENRVATRNPVWAMAQMLRAKYGARLQDKFLDLDHFASEAIHMDENQIFFDWVFDQRGTIWEALKVPTFVMRAIPMLIGARVSFVRDKPQTFPTFFINPENTIENSFSLDKKLFDIAENDGLEVEYIDPDTFLVETVVCKFPESEGRDLRRLQLRGVTDRQRAFSLGMFLWSREMQEREVVSVKTGLEGYIPTYGDLGRFASDIPRWGASGYITKEISNNVITLSDSVEFEEGEVHQLAIRGRRGQDLGPYTVVAGDKPNEVIPLSVLPTDEFFFDFQHEPPFYVFGKSNLVGRVCRIVDMSPDQGEGVSLTAVVDDPRRHADFGEAPAIESTATTPPIPEAPLVTSLVVTAVPNSITTATASWSPAFGARSYILETSTDGETWAQVDEVIGTNYTLPIVAGLLYVRVAAVNVGVGRFANWVGEVGEVSSIPSNVTGLNVQPEFTGLSAHIRWNPAPQATSYLITIATGGVERCTREVSSLDYEFTLDEAIDCDAVSRTVTFTVVGRNVLGDSEASAFLTVTNPAPTVPQNITSTLISSDSHHHFYRLSWGIVLGVDICKYRVWGSETQGFVADDTNLIFDGLANSADISILKAEGEFPAYYWRVAAIDVWDDETTLSEEQTI